MAKYSQVDQPPVVVAGAFQTGVVLMRNLLRHKVETCCIDCNPSKQGFKTVYGKAYLCPNPDTHPAEWEQFMSGMRQIFPDRPVEDLTDKDEIFHVLYDMDDRFQVPGEQYIRSGRTYEQDGYVAKWRGIRDDKGRVVVAICHNMHLGDAWEWADDPEYPEQFASMAFRVGLNYVMYSMTH